MFAKQTFENNIYMKIFRWVYIVLGSNLSFVLVNIPFFLAAVSLALDIRNLPLFLFSLLFVGPGAMAFLATLDEFKEKKEIDPFRVYFNSYRKWVTKGSLYWLIGWAGIVIFSVDFYFVMITDVGKWLFPLLVVFIVLTLAVSINAWYFQLRNPNTTAKEVLRIAVYYALKKWYVSILNSCLFTFIFIMMLLKPQFGYLLTPGILMGIVYLNTSRLHRV